MSLRTRRDVLKMCVLVASAGSGACYRDGELGPATLSEEQSARFFPQSLASGDPRPDSVVLWTRVEDAQRSRQDLQLELIVARDPELLERVDLGGAAASLLAPAALDHCLRVRLEGLEPGTTYYYRFRYQSLGGSAESRVGRTKTAPDEDADVAPRFAVICCQDYSGKYFHLLRHAAEQELDFFVHLGDYVYESLAAPSFQSETDARRVTLSEPEQALRVGSGDDEFLAAQSLSNYRDLYKTYRSDPDLQALHERYPMLAIWDDHEFSDDSHGQTANYLDGREDETQPERRAAADRAWYEYMPVDFERAPASAPDASKGFPDDFAIQRSFVFGRHLELWLTDLRRFRPDHLVPEDAAPGAIFLTQAELAEQFEELPPDAVPYLELESFAGGSYLEALLENAERLAVTPEKLSGLVSATWINAALESLGSESVPEPIDLEDESLERGYAYHCLLKTAEFSRIGARYVLAARPFHALARQRFEATQGESELVMGAAQREWFLSTLRESTRTFKVWGSEVALLSRHIDLTGVSFAPAELQTRIVISAEDWDGFPNERQALLSELAAAGNVVILSGDLHCFFAGTPHLEGESEARVVELVTGSVSSTTWLDGIEGVLGSDASLPMNAGLLIAAVGDLLVDRGNRPNPHLAFEELGRNGYSVIEVGAEQLDATLFTLEPSVVATSPSELETSLDDLLRVEKLRVLSGAPDLYREIEGEYRRWDMTEMSWT